MVGAVLAKVGYHPRPHHPCLIHGTLQFVKDTFSSLPGLHHMQQSSSNDSNHQSSSSIAKGLYNMLTPKQGIT